MNIDQEIERLNKEIKRLQTAIQWLLAHRLEFEAIGSDVMVMASCIDLDDLSRDQAVLAMKTLKAGDWNKKPNGWAEGKMDYEGQVDGQTVRLFNVEPPPSCKLVEHWVDVPAVPATRVKKLKLECKPEPVGAT